MGGIFHLTQQQIRRGGIYMLLAILQTLFNFMLKLGVILGLAFIMVCTVFVIVCIIRGDIKINIVRNEAERENK